MAAGESPVPGLLEGTISIPQAIRIHGEGMSVRDRAQLAKDLLKMNKANRQAPIQAMRLKVGEWIRESRHGASLTQESLAYRIGLGRPALASMEAGRQSITMDVYFHLCSEFHKDPVDELWKIVDPK